MWANSAKILGITRTFAAVALAVAALGFAACADTSDGTAPGNVIGEAGALGIHTSQAEIDGDALTLDQILARGERLFTASFNTLDGAGRPETTDVSPNNFRAPRTFPDNFNRISGPDANSCSSCHTIPRLGGGGDNATNVFVLADRLEFVNFDGGEGDGLERHTLRTVGNERTSVSLFGSGYVELLAREMTADLHAIRDGARREARQSGAPVTAELTTKGIDFGRLTAHPDGTLNSDEVEGIEADLVIRPFMQKGTIISLREFAVKAMNQHFGMQASERFGDTVDRDGDGIADELSRGDVTALVLFQATLPAPAAARPQRDANREAAQRGQALFSSLGCATCHVPELPLNSPLFSEPNPFNPAGKLQAFEVDDPYTVDLTSLNDGGLRRGADGAIMVPVFTDFKRHRMGDVLDNEALEEEGVPTDEWLTRKLWGFASEPPFLHNGRATLISEAILAHGGEAQPSRDSFAALPQQDRAALIEFLETLQIPPETAETRAESPRPYGLEISPVWAALGGGLAGALIALACCLTALRLRKVRGGQ